MDFKADGMLETSVAQAENGGKEKKETFFVNKFKMLLRLFFPSRRPVRPPFLKKNYSS